ncbi:hypothetical protein BDV19DRAFT_356685 [Aspergillus venezuelensis]
MSPAQRRRDLRWGAHIHGYCGIEPVAWCYRSKNAEQEGFSSGMTVPTLWICSPITPEPSVALCMLSSGDAAKSASGKQNGNKYRNYVCGKLSGTLEDRGEDGIAWIHEHISASLLSSSIFISTKAKLQGTKPGKTPDIRGSESSRAKRQSARSRPLRTASSFARARPPLSVAHTASPYN